MSRQDQRKAAKAKKRQATLKNRRIKTGSNINPKNMMVYNKCS